MGRFLESMGCVAAYAACLGIAVIGVGCGVESAGERAGLRFEGTEPGDCEDGADNDADGLFDCDDPGCAASPLCDGGTGGTSGTGGGAGGTSGAGGAGGSMLCATVNCDDQNQCTEDACNPMDGACGYTNVIDGLSCDFEGLPGVCNAGACEDAMLCATVNCDDQNQCTEDACDPMDGTCGYTNATEGTACAFGSLPGVCTAGVCEDAMLCADVDCDDSDQCTQDVCNPMDGECLYANATDGTACDFGGLPGVCNAGACEDAMLCATVDCDDGNQCTEDACDPMDGQCGYANATDGTSCDFGGLPSVCATGVCQDLSRCFVADGACLEDADCGNPPYTCDQTINRCLRIVSGCDDSNDCTDDSCDPMDGSCDHIPAPDGTLCTLGGSSGACSNGTCSTAACVTNALCHTCPTNFLCESDADCFPGYICIPSGCETHGGAAIKQCQPSKAPSCTSIDECPNSSDYRCGPVGGSSRCLRVTPGCNPSTESYDCAPGFSCEDGDCIDRRVPCNDFIDCPKSYVCKVEPSASFCVRVYRTCHRDEDCAGFGGACADVDGDGTAECTGVLSTPPGPCVNSTCTAPSAPVCEVAGTGTTAACGNHGLCRPGIDDCGPGFECTGLSQDDRTECVPTGGTCQASPCPLQQVCAAPRNGVDPPSCQSGSGA